MTEYGFQNGMRRLAGIYGEQAYPAERKMIIGKKLRPITDEDWAEIVTEIIGSQKYAPMADKVAEIARPWLDKRYAEINAGRKVELDRRRSAGTTCKYCDDAGLIFAFKRDAGYEFVFRCPDRACIGAEYNCNTRDVIWTDDWLSEYLPQFNCDEFKNHFERANPNWIKLREAKIAVSEGRFSSENYQKLCRELRGGKVKLEVVE